MRKALPVLVGIWLASCGIPFLDEEPPPAGNPTGGTADAGCARPCGSDCCPGGLICNLATRKCDRPCRPSCDGRQCGNDGCGGTCGTCGGGSRCNESFGRCDTCNRSCSGKTCGDDGCGGTCGTCPSGQACTTAGTCQLCSTESNAAFCARQGKSCGPVSAPDSCGVARSVDCGSCTAPGNCGGGGTPGVCGSPCSTPPEPAAFCSRLGKNCGTLSDGCGGRVDCGTCAAGTSCGAGGTPNVCGSGTCTPETDRSFCQRLGKNCGTVTDFDNCDRSRTVGCGSCSHPTLCGEGPVSGTCCTPETDGAFCQRLSKNCGGVTALDNCGRSRSASCGGCTSPSSCGGAGTANVCGCIARESDAVLCSREGKNCGATTLTDSCGKPRAASCGTCDPNAACSAGNLCVCSPGTQQCSGGCRDTQSDPQNCGQCGSVCTAPPGGTVSCMAGKCVRACGGAKAVCGTARSPTCVDVQIDLANCGSCGKVCPVPVKGTAACTNGTCSASCQSSPTPLTQCSGSCVDLKTDAWNCGKCGSRCADSTGYGRLGCRNGQCVCTRGLCGSQCCF